MAKRVLKLRKNNSTVYGEFVEGSSVSLGRDGKFQAVEFIETNKSGASISKSGKYEAFELVEKGDTSLIFFEGSGSIYRLPDIPEEDEEAWDAFWYDWREKNTDNPLVMETLDDVVCSITSEDLFKNGEFLTEEGFEDYMFIYHVITRGMEWNLYVSVEEETDTGMGMRVFVTGDPDGMDLSTGRKLFLETGLWDLTGIVGSVEDLDIASEDRDREWAQLLKERFGV